MNRPHFSFLPLILTAFFLCLVTESAATQEVGLVTVDVKDVAKGYRANSLRLKPVMNDKKELIGTIDDFMFGRDDGVFVILAVGDSSVWVDTSWLSPSRALSSTIRTAASSCLAQVKQHCGNCRFSSTIDDLVTPPSMSSGTREPQGSI
jgi:sporulation protein YlmC with PRC-barrel domain